jgi:serine/threonine protein kinase
MKNKIKGYEILEPIGSGAFGRTFRVREAGKIYAMKVLKPSLRA